MYQVDLSRAAQKNLRKIDKRFQEKILSSLISLKTNPFIGEKMIGKFQDSYRIKIPPIRIIYVIAFKSKKINVRNIGHRGDIYK